MHGLAHLLPYGQRAQQAQVGDDAVDPAGGQGRAQDVERGVAGVALGDDLGEHGVVVRRDLQAGLGEAVDADAGHAVGALAGEGRPGDQTRGGL